MVLLDIGCSGGIDASWDIFKPNITAYGIDPVTEEVDRLNNSKDKFEKYHYFLYKVGLPSSHPFIIDRQLKTNNSNNTDCFFPRTSANDILQYLKVNNTFSEDGIYSNQWDKLTLTDNVTTIDDFINMQKINDLDFIKVDIDGDDVSAIISTEKSLKCCSVLGFMMETNWSGSSNDTDHVIHNTDRLLRNYGYSLVDIKNIRKYSSKHLTDIFDYKYGQTKTGRILQSDTVYLIDPFSKNKKIDLSPIKLVKLILLYVFFGLESWAAEILIEKKNELNNIINVNKCLDILTNEMHPQFNTYDEYLHEYKNNPEIF